LELEITVVHVEKLGEVGWIVESGLLLCHAAGSGKGVSRFAGVLSKTPVEADVFGEAFPPIRELVFY
jgi:hypothetical protein